MHIIYLNYSKELNLGKVTRSKRQEKVISNDVSSHNNLQILFSQTGATVFLSFTN